MQEINEIISGNIRITHTRPEHAAALEALQYVVFPNLAENEILHTAHYLKHLEIFPEGQLVALHEDNVIGGTTTMRYDMDPDHPAHHTFSETVAGGWLTTHMPNGEWLYGIDVSVHPDYRNRGIARAFYAIRQQIAKQLGCRGQLTVGMLNGYHTYAHEMTVKTYFEKVKSHEIFDPTVSVQEKIGFRIVSLMEDYLNDPTCGNAGAVIVME
jgi:GNAT superfamily N-acetyltransferase